MQVFRVGAIFVVVAAFGLAQATGDPNHTNGRKTTRQATRDESLWRSKPVLPPPPGGPVVPAPSSTAQPPARPCPQSRTREFDVPADMMGQPILRGATASALNGAIVIEGDQQYQDMVLCELDRVQSIREVGGLLLTTLSTALTGRGNRVTIRDKGLFAAGPHTQPADGSARAWVMASDPALTSVYRSEPRKIPFFNYYFVFESPLDPTRQAAVRGQGTSSIVYFDPVQFPISARGTPGHVAIFHELVHAWHFAIGKGNLTPYSTASGSVNPQWVTIEEYVTIAAPDWQFTENAYRRAAVQPPRNCVSASCF